MRLVISPRCGGDSDWFSERGVDGDLRRSAVLATHEAVANAIEHANPCNTIWVRATIEKARLTVEVTDSGTWRLETSENDERGRGLMLIRGLVSRLDIQRQPTGTTVRMALDG